MGTPKSGTSQPETAPKAKPTSTGTDPNAGLTSITFNGAQGNYTRSGFQYSHLSPKEIARRTAQQKLITAKKQSSNYKTNAFARLMAKRNLVPSMECKPTFEVYLPSVKRPLNKRRVGGRGFCEKTLDSVIKYRERKYQNQENEFRIFIEGAEVTPYVEGSVSWTIESTGGVNSCRFVLNNTQDAFIVTPENVCAGPYNIGAWRIPYFRRGKSNNLRVYTGFDNRNWRVDEVAKWQIYKRKYEAVNPEGALKQIDRFTGMWLYPLNPFSCIFNKNDAVRVFVRIPHVLAARRPKTKEWHELWMPAFTGFIDRYSWSDAPIEGKRTVSITCYDYRGLMERMRVRVYGNPQTQQQDDKPKKPKGAGGQQSKDKGAQAAKKNEPSPRGNVFLRRAIALGKSFKKKLGQVYGATKSSKIYANQADPYEYGKDGFYLENTYIDLHILWVIKLASGGAGDKACIGSSGKFNIERGYLARAGVDYGVECSNQVIRLADEHTSKVAEDITRAIGYALQDIMVIYDLVGDPYVIKADAKEVRTDAYTASGSGTTSRVIALTVVPLQQTKDKYAVDIDNAKKTCVVQLFADALSLISPKSPYGSDTTGQALFEKYAKMYYVADAYASAPTSLKLFSDPRTTQTEMQGWKKWVDSASWLTANEKEDFKLDGPYLVRERYKTAMAGLVKEVNNALFNKKNRMLTSDTKQIVARNSVNLVKLIKKQKDDIASLYKLLLSTTSEAKKKKIYAQIKSAEARQKELEAIYSDQASTTAKDSWRERLDFNEPHPELNVVSWTYVASSKSEFDSALLGTNAYAEISNRLGPLMTLWKEAYTRPQNRARSIAASTKNSLINRVVTNKTVVNGEYSQFVTIAGTGGTKAVNINEALMWINWKREQLKKVSKNESIKYSTAQWARGWVQSIRDQTQKSKQEQKRSLGVADQLLKIAHFEVKHAGIFADLRTQVETQPHPLMGKSFEESVEYLCCEQQKILMGLKVSINNYVDRYNTAKGNKREFGGHTLDKWNRLVLFGLLGRPLTYAEVTLAGQGTTSDVGSVFCPYNSFCHILMPGEGSGASTIIQKHTGHSALNSMNVAYETRKKLLDDICSVLDYQYWVSGWGDFIFEFPHYNSFPRDFGSIVHQAYTLKSDWINATIAEEAQDIPTAWVITGKNVDKTNKPTSGNVLTTHYFRTIVLMAPILARRIGVRVENINLKIPGLGGAGDTYKTKDGKSTSLRNKQAIDQLKIYGLFHIQRQLGMAHTMQVGMPFRPYIVPNRPIWFIPRQRIGLVKSVTHSMQSPNGTCSTEANLAHTRWLFRDGTFRFIAGGPRLPISYVSFFTGVPPRDGGKFIQPKEGTSTGEKAVNRGKTGAGCSGDLATAAKSASYFSASVANQWGAAYSGTANIRRISLPAGTAVDTVTAGIRSTSQINPHAPKDLTSAEATRATSKDPFQYTLDVWKSIPRPGLNNMMYSVGYLRSWKLYGTKAYIDPMFTRDGWKKRSRTDAGHDGWDLPAPIGTPCLTPFDILKAKVILRVGEWSSSYGKQGWARVKGGRGDYSYKTLYAFRVGKNPEKVVKADGQWIKIWADQFTLYRHLGGNASGITLTRGAAGGIHLIIHGYASLPEEKLKNGGKLYANLMYVHLSDIRKLENGKILGGPGNRSRSGRPILTRGEVIGWVGISGTSIEHLHIQMQISNKDYKSPTAEEQLKIVTAANTAFIDAQLYARAGNYNLDGTNPLNKEDFPKFNDKAHKWWDNYYFRKAIDKPKGVITVGDVVKFYQSRSSYRRFVPSSLGNNKWITVHPGFFFSPYQLLRYKKGEWTRSRRAVYGNLSSDLQNDINRIESGAARYSAQTTSLCARMSNSAKSFLVRERYKCTSKLGGTSAISPIGVVIPTLSTPASARRKYNNCVSEVDRQLKAISKGQGLITKARPGTRRWYQGKSYILSVVNNYDRLRKDYDRLAKQQETKVRQQLGSKTKHNLVPIH